MDITFGERLKALREDAGLSQRALAKELGLGNTTISAWESNQIPPTLPRLILIAQYFGVTIDFLACIKDSE